VPPRLVIRKPPGTYRVEIRNESDPPFVRQVTVGRGERDPVISHVFRGKPQ